MQNYQPNPIPPEFFAVALTLLIWLIIFFAEKAFAPQIFAARCRAEYRRISEQEQYFRDLQKGLVKERKRRDLWRSSYKDEIEFEDFLTSLWRESEFWYPKRRAAFYLFERERKFIIHRDMGHSPTEEKMDAIEYVV